MSASKRTIWLVTDYGGEWEDSWERTVIAFTDKAAAEECARVREARQRDEDDFAVTRFVGCNVSEIPLVDFGDKEEEK